MHALLNPVMMTESVKHRPDQIVLQISLNVPFEIFPFPLEDLFYLRECFMEICIIIPFRDLLDHII